MSDELAIAGTCSNEQDRPTTGVKCTVPEREEAEQVYEHRDWCPEAIILASLPPCVQSRVL